MKLGQIQVTLELLAGMLRLPPEHTIRAVLPPSDIDIASRTLRLLIEGPQMREGHEGVAPEIRSMFIDTRGRAHFGDP